MTRGFTAVAIVAAHNEADIIGAVISHLIEQGLLVYLIDHRSTDRTAEIAAPFLGRGLLAIEPFPGDRFPHARDAFAWTDILTRKTELSAELDADWFIHHDADEFRESPWEHLTLLEAIRRVDRLGYNAIDFEVFNFQPTDDTFRPGEDPQHTFRFFEPGAAWDKAQVKCWKKQSAAPDLVSSGGHDVTFPDRRVFPIRFLLRHYPFRSQAHGTRKVFKERRPRRLPEETSRGWHVHYDGIAEGEAFVRSIDTLREFNADEARLGLALRNRDAEERQASLEQSSATIATQKATIADRDATIGAQTGVIATHEATIADRDAAIDRLARDLESGRAEIQRLQTELDMARAEMEARARQVRERSATVEALVGDLASARQLVNRLLADIDAQRREIDGLYASKSWRWTRLFRRMIGAFSRR
jgi:hypothetical protein